MVHMFSFDGLHIVNDTASGAVHVFDDVSYDIINEYARWKETNQTKDKDIFFDHIKSLFADKYSEKDIYEAWQEIKHLEDEGLLFSQDDYEQYASDLHEYRGIKALCLHVSHDCNMRCKYCFASTGDFGTGRLLMDEDTAKSAIDFLVENSAGRRNLEVDFFGGEPLMNFDVVKKTVEYARSIEAKKNKHFRFTITTNALALTDEKMKYINENFDNVVLSIDGRKEINDQMRKLPDGKGTYDFILDKIKKMVMLRGDKSYYVRGTFTHHNLDFAKDVLHLAGEGFKNISVEPVVAPKDMDYAITDSDLTVIMKEYEILTREYIKRREEGKGFNFFHFMIDLDQGPCIRRRLTGCGAGYDYIAVTPEGNIYPCHQFVGIDGFLMGNVKSKSLNREIANKFMNSNIYTKDECSKCWARYYCSGGCAANAYNFNGDINKPPLTGCEMAKKRIECSLWISAKER